MLNLLRTGRPRPKCDGSSRREFLQAGTLGLFGLTLPGLLRARAAAAAQGRPVRQKSVILLFLDGGASHIDTFDPKMEAPQEFRCLFGSVQTRLPGVAFSAMVPQIADRADRLAVCRSFTQAGPLGGGHDSGMHWLKTGHPWPEEFKGKALMPQQRPSIGSIVARHHGAINPQTGVPTYVVMTKFISYAGDDANWLGQAYAPFRLGAGAQNNALLNNMTLKIAPDRLQDRRALLGALDQLDRRIDQSGNVKGMDDFQKQAINVLAGKAKEALDVTREDARTRANYGPGVGEQLLLARRLCEMGAGFVTINDIGWDHHAQIVPGFKQLCPPIDRAVAAFLDDVRSRGLENDILLVITGEMGRTPRIDAFGTGNAGRNHWGGLNTLVLAGGGLKMGQVIGESDAKAAFPQNRPVWPQDLMATLFRYLGIDLELQYTNPGGRPVYMLEGGKPIDELFA